MILSLFSTPGCVFGEWFLSASAVSPFKRTSHPVWSSRGFCSDFSLPSAPRRKTLVLDVDEAEPNRVFPLFLLPFSRLLFPVLK